VLILGWNRRTPALLHAFDRVSTERFEVDVLSLIPATERLDDMERYDTTPLPSVRHLAGDYTSRADLVAVHPEIYDHIVLLAVDWALSEAESDARTVLGFLVLQETLQDKKTRPAVLIEWMDPANETMLEHYPHESLVTPVLLSSLLTHITLRRELRSVFDVLLDSEGPEIAIKTADQLGLANRPFCFDDLYELLGDSGEIPLGLYILTPEPSSSGAHILLNPDRNTEWILKTEDAVVVLTTS